MRGRKFHLAVSYIKITTSFRKTRNIIREEKKKNLTPKNPISFFVEVPLLRQLVQWFLSWMTGILWMDGKSRYAAGL